ncbi:zinc ribbon domain-containing protein [Candidatus Thorarchaeota archaeon]|nr:MAG: zinc ribbon domain-containing protein [Candidatus Thorarchaeota archaeon]
MTKDRGISFGILIPIVVLVIVMLSSGERWLMIPITILFFIFIGDAYQNMKIRQKREQIDYWKAPDAGIHRFGSTTELQRTDRKPIYDQKKQKEQGVTCGTVIPIVIVGWLFLMSGSLVFMIPLLCLLASLIDNLTKSTRRTSIIKEEMRKENIRTVSDISSRTGLPEERVRESIVTEKRSGASNVWFDSESGEITRSPIKVIEPAEKLSIGCVYCGFALKPQDRFCPFCGAPIKAYK